MTVSPVIELAAGADENGLARMMAGLLRQNIASKPHKEVDFAALHGTVAIVADDADVALTLIFEHGRKLTVHDGVCGLPQVTIRGPSDAIIALSNLPMATSLGLPIPHPRDVEAIRAIRTVLGALRQRRLWVHGAALHLPLVLKLGRLLSVNG